MGAKFSDIGKIIAQALQSKPVLEEGAKVIVEAVPLRTRLGKGVKEAEGPALPLPKLKTKTKSNRKLLAEKGELTGPGATPAKSGLNRTGDMLSGLKAIIKNGKFEIRLKDKQQEIKAGHVLKNNPDFAFMNISKAEMNRMIKAMSVKITEILSKIKFDSL